MGSSILVFQRASLVNVLCRCVPFRKAGGLESSLFHIRVNCLSIHKYYVVLTHWRLTVCNAIIIVLLLFILLWWNTIISIFMCAKMLLHCVCVCVSMWNQWHYYEFTCYWLYASRQRKRRKRNISLTQAFARSKRKRKCSGMLCHSLKIVSFYYSIFSSSLFPGWRQVDPYTSEPMNNSLCILILVQW